MSLQLHLKNSDAVIYTKEIFKHFFKACDLYSSNLNKYGGFCICNSARRKNQKFSNMK